MGAHLPATWPFVGQSAPWDPWGPFLCLASPCPSHTHLPTSASSTFPLIGVSTSMDWTVLGVTSGGPGAQPSHVRSTHVRPELRPASCPQHCHAESPGGPHQPGCGNPGPQRRSLLRHRAHALPPIRRGVDERHGSPTAAPRAEGTGPKPLLCFWEQVSGPPETSLQVAEPAERLAVCSSSAHARAGTGSHKALQKCPPWRPEVPS